MDGVDRGWEHGCGILDALFLPCAVREWIASSWFMKRYVVVAPLFLSNVSRSCVSDDWW